jgi:hypothetical protein
LEVNFNNQRSLKTTYKTLINIFGIIEPFAARNLQKFHTTNPTKFASRL